MEVKECKEEAALAKKENEMLDEWNRLYVHERKKSLLCGQARKWGWCQRLSR